MAGRRPRSTPEGSADFLDTLRRLPIQIERREARWLRQAMLPLAREHRLSAYEAAYLVISAIVACEWAMRSLRRRMVA